MFDVLSRDSATRHGNAAVVVEDDTCMARIRGARGDASRTGLPRLFKGVERFRKLEASGKPCGVSGAIARRGSASNLRWPQLNDRRAMEETRRLTNDEPHGKPPVARFDEPNICGVLRHVVRQSAFDASTWIDE